MPEDPLHPLVTRFLSDHISSVAQLEILLLLQTNPPQPWTPAAIARELRIEPAGALLQLRLLLASRLLHHAPPDLYNYAPSTPDLAAAVTALAQAYLLRRVTVITAIFAKPDPASNLRAFSDAFNLRKDPPNAPPRG